MEMSGMVFDGFCMTDSLFAVPSRLAQWGSMGCLPRSAFDWLTDEHSTSFYHETSRMLRKGLNHPCSFRWTHQFPHPLVPPVHEQTAPLWRHGQRGRSAGSAQADVARDWWPDGTSGAQGWLAIGRTTGCIQCILESVFGLLCGVVAAPLWCTRCFSFARWRYTVWAISIFKVHANHYQYHINIFTTQFWQTNGRWFLSSEHFRTIQKILANPYKLGPGARGMNPGIYVS